MLSSDSPSISVVIPAHNVEGCLADAVESVQQQTIQPHELIVVDDGSTDASGSIARQATGVTCLEQENRGASAARNTGIRFAAGEIIAFLDADDLWLPNHLEILLRPFQVDSQIDFVWGTSVRIDIGQSPSKESGSPDGEPWLGFLLGAGLFRRDLFDRVGFFDQDFRTCNDLEWFSRARQLGACFKHIPDRVLAYRKRPGSLTSDVSQMQTDRMRMFRRAAARRREANLRYTNQSESQQ